MLLNLYFRKLKLIIKFYYIIVVFKKILEIQNKKIWALCNIENFPNEFEELQ